MNNYAPIILFAYNRVDVLHRTVNALKKNNLAKDSDLFVYVDGPKNSEDNSKVKKVCKYVRTIDEGFKSVSIKFDTKNKGLGASVIAGVSEILNVYGKAIIVEDDLYCTPNFLDFMNQGLNKYESDERIISINGYGLKVKRPKDYIGDVYLSIRSSSWGWATWKNRWDKIDWEVKDWEALSINKTLQKKFNRGGSDMFSMLKGYMEGRNKSWAIRFCYTQSKLGLYSVAPFISKVENNGFGINATNCKQKYSRFKIEIDKTNNIDFLLPENLIPSEEILKSNYKYHSLGVRLYSKIRKLLNI